MLEHRITPKIEALARGWYGYGRWEAPYWFIGIEPGGDDLDACERMWVALGQGELVDIEAHHEDHKRDHFGIKARTQETWRALIWLLLSFKGEDPSRGATLDYQRKHLGRSNDETALIEISCLPAKHNGVPVPRELFRDERIATLRARLQHYQPRFAVFYSPDEAYRDAWNQITGHILERGQVVHVGRSACIMTYHPQGKWSKAYWTEIGKRLR